MAKRRRGRGQGSANQNQNNQGQNHGNQNHGSGGGQNHGGGQGGGQGQRRQGDSSGRFWGDPTAKRATPSAIRPTPDPAALVKSLGNPPLSPTASHQLAVVYEEAVRAATALAAANGLLDGDELD
jgi:hypothetical protein